MSQNRWKVLILALLFAASGLAFAREARQPPTTNCANLRSVRDLADGDYERQLAMERWREIGCPMPPSQPPRRQGGGR
jgi:hypothetical protein